MDVDVDVGINVGVDVNVDVDVDVDVALTDVRRCGCWRCAPIDLNLSHNLSSQTQQGKLVSELPQ